MFKSLAILLLFLSSAVAAEKDSLSLKENLANRYMETMDLKSKALVWQSQLKKDFPEMDTTEISGIYENKVDWSSLEKEVIKILVNLYTKNELELIVQFHTSPTGKSIARKTPQFIEMWLPIVKEELLRHFPKPE